MGKNSYLGGGSKIAISQEGTSWETRWNDAQLAEIGQYYDRWDKRDDVNQNAGAIALKRRRKEFTYFLCACAQAFSEETLSKTFPPPPRSLLKAVKRAGGNVEWLSSDTARLALLTRMIQSRRVGVAKFG